MKTLLFILLTISLYGQDSVFVVDSHVDTHLTLDSLILYEFKSDTTHYNYIFYIDNTFVRCEPGIIIESGKGHERIFGYFIEEPKIEIFTDSGKAISKKNYLYYLK